MAETWDGPGSECSYLYDRRGLILLALDNLLFSLLPGFQRVDNLSEFFSFDNFDMPKQDDRNTEKSSAMVPT